MATPRRVLVDPNNPLFYHVVSRCVRRSWLCGYDRKQRRNFSHRKAWIEDRLRRLGALFAVDVYAYAIMSNHFHLVVYFDPTAPMRWEDEEVADRWLRICPPKLPDGSIDEGLLEFQKEQVLNDPDRLERLRANLGSLSTFMKLLKQPIARRANLEDGCAGHFFDQRFYSGALLTEEAVLAAMAYVDLNPIRAKIAHSIANSKYTSIRARLNASESLEEYLLPFVAGVGSEPPFREPLVNYIGKLKVLAELRQPEQAPAKVRRWRDQVFNLKRRQRAFGSEAKLRDWADERGWQMREIPLPS